jgi:hypothetical protein
MVKHFPLQKKYPDLLFNGVTDKDDYQPGASETIELSAGLDVQTATFTLGHEALIHVDADADNLNQIDKNMAEGKYDGQEGDRKLEKDCIDKLYDTAARDHKNYKNDLVKKFKNYCNELGEKYKQKYEEKKMNYDKDGKEVL